LSRKTKDLEAAMMKISWS